MFLFIMVSPENIYNESYLGWVSGVPMKKVVKHYLWKENYLLILTTNFNAIRFAKSFSKLLSLLCHWMCLKNMNKDPKIQLYRHLLNVYKRIWCVSYTGFLKSETLFPVKPLTISNWIFRRNTVMHFSPSSPFLFLPLSLSLSLSHTHTHTHTHN